MWPKLITKQNRPLADEFASRQMGQIGSQAIEIATANGRLLRQPRIYLCAMEDNS